MTAPPPSSPLASDRARALAELARTYVWWSDPARVVAESPDYVIAQVMDIGTWSDIGRLHAIVGPEGLAAAYQSDYGRRMSAKGRAFWSLRLNLPLAEPLKRSFAERADV